MGIKIANHRSYGQKLVSLFSKLLFSSESHSLSDLARMLDCSKQTVLRLVEDIRLAYGVEIEEAVVNRRKYYRLKQTAGTPPVLPLSDTDINLLMMCQFFTKHLLGRLLFEETAQAIEKANTRKLETGFRGTGNYAAYLPGSIDYTPQHDNIRSLIQAMEERMICRVTYQNIMADKSKTYYIKPFKLFSHKDTVYLHAGLARYPGARYFEPEFNPILAVHRLHRVEKTERTYALPNNYDFEKEFNSNFGIIKGETFNVTVRFTGWAARHVAERVWSPDQRVTTSGDGIVKLAFSSASESEIVSWVLSFGLEATVESPSWLAEKVKQIALDITGKYP